MWLCVLVKLILQVIRHISEIHKLPSLAKSSLTPGSQQEGLFKKMSHLTRLVNTYVNNWTISNTGDREKLLAKKMLQLCTENHNMQN